MSLTQTYHEETKYRPETIGHHPPLDPATQPRPYKDFHSLERIHLASRLGFGRDRTTGRTLMPPAGSYEPVSLEALSLLLLHTNGVTAVSSQAGEKHYFRAAPSAGALYPTEVYVAIREVEGISDGLYNYQVRDHSLAPLCEGDFRGDLEFASFGHPAVKKAKIIVLLSAVFFRSSWRYHDRAYRRILLDTGHVLGNLEAFAEEVGLEAFPIPGFRDRALNSLFLFEDDAEGFLAMVPLLEPGTLADEVPRGVHRSATTPGPHGTSSLLLQMHHAGDLDSVDPMPPITSTKKRTLAVRESITLDALPIDWRDRLSETILLRRSTRTFTGNPIERAALLSVLDDSHRPSSPDDAWRTFVDVDRFETYVAVSRVEGLADGVYRYDIRRGSLELLSMRNTSAACGYICLGQDLGTDAAALVFHCVDLEALVEEHGDRGYRYVGLDAGRIGQRLNLAALRCGLGVSGIGGYFDDQINELFDLPVEVGTIYVTCLGDVPRRESARRA